MIKCKTSPIIVISKSCIGLDLKNYENNEFSAKNIIIYNII